ncbi:MAG: deoxyribodipyrimidine photo-lyase [Candidatus Thorarchaeota archaeon]
MDALSFPKINKMKYERIRKLNKFEGKKGPILYWMSRDQRVKDNWGLLFSQELALKYEYPLIVIFNLTPKFLNASRFIYNFMLNGLQKVERDLMKLDISFHLELGTPINTLPQFIERYHVSTIITDFSPLKIKRQWISELLKKVKIPFYEVDTHNIIPCWIISNKKEYAAYTFRQKVKKVLDLYLDDIPSLKKHRYKEQISLTEVKWINIKKVLEISDSRDMFSKPISGEKEALMVLEAFKINKIKNYNQNKNNPNLDGTSNLSPYLHFGQICSQRVILELRKLLLLSSLKGNFYDEIIVRKELSDNYCYYNKNYDNFQGFPEWARKTINEHRNDLREYIYSINEFETGKTHDDLWNAAQMQMVNTGKMHGYLRMYWCKKIFEWTETPERAMEIAIYLNDKYELDGRDPNGYVGIAWSIGGVHDRAWSERKIFGKIRYMSYNGMKRKFNVKNYISQNLNNN